MSLFTWSYKVCFCFDIYRFTVNAGPVSSIIISNKLNNENILKVWTTRNSFLFIYLFNVSKIHYFLSTRIFQTWMLALHLHLCSVLRARRSILVQEVWRKRHKYVFPFFITSLVPSVHLHHPFVFSFSLLQQ